MSSSGFAALCSAFGRYDVVHIHAEGPAFFAWLPKLLGKRVVVTIHGEGEFIGGYAMYGYCKDERNKSRLVVDEYAAEELKNLKGEKMRMYEEYAAGTLSLDNYKSKKLECDRKIAET